MATCTDQVFHGRLADVQHDNCISDLYAWVQASETNPNCESSNSSGAHNESCKLDTGPHESIQEFLQRLFEERDIDDIPRAPCQDDLTKKVKLDVDFYGQLDSQAFLDGLTSLEDYFTWYHIDDPQLSR